MQEKVEKAKAWGTTISVWGKLIIGLFVFIISIGTAWYQIQTNSSDNVRQDVQFKETLEIMKREFEIWGQRSDKRYKRTKQESEESHKHSHEQDEAILELTKEIWYMKGKLDERDRNN